MEAASSRLLSGTDTAAALAFGRSLEIGRFSGLLPGRGVAYPAMCAEATIPRRGYRFVGEVTEVAVQKPPAAHPVDTGWLLFVKVEPRFDLLRSDARFAQLLKGIGLS